MVEKLANLDITFDVRTDSKGGDPDRYSRTLKQYHKILWSKKLPNGMNFNLDDNQEGRYLYHKSELGEFILSSDSIIHTYYKWKRTEELIKQIPKDEIEYFYNKAYTTKASLPNLPNDMLLWYTFMTFFTLNKRKNRPNQVFVHRNIAYR